jgi:uncharacterized protein (TIGR02186 family)
MRITPFLILAFAFISFMSTGARAQNDKILTVDLAGESVDITTGFTGGRIVLFGVKEEPGELAIVVSGPSRRTVVRRKDSFLGMWMNRESVEFLDVPVYYDYAVSEPEPLIAPADVLRDHNIGLNALDFSHLGDEKESLVLSFKEALIRNRQTKGLFPLKPRNIIFLKDDFFRTTFYVPSNVPTGEYSIKTYLFQEGKIKDVETMSMRVAQTGFSADLYRFAHNQSLAYGLAAVLMAVIFGWSANTFLRRD